MKIERLISMDNIAYPAWTEEALWSRGKEVLEHGEKQDPPVLFKN
jgi:hypothetical protein